MQKISEFGDATILTTQYTSQNIPHVQLPLHSIPDSPSQGPNRRVDNATISATQYTAQNISNPPPFSTTFARHSRLTSQSSHAIRPPDQRSNTWNSPLHDPKSPQFPLYTSTPSSSTAPKPPTNYSPCPRGPQSHHPTRPTPTHCSES
jgi:hypothetical protein